MKRLNSEMASRTILLHLRRRLTTAAPTTTAGGGGVSQVKCLSSTPDLLSSKTRDDDDNDNDNDDGREDDLKSRIFRLRLPKRSAVNVIQKWVDEGNSVNLPELRTISRDLKKSTRFKHALEITEWMVSHDEYELSDTDYAARIDLMTKVFGLDTAERYFEGLPEAAKTNKTYTALLHSYAGSKQIDKAEDLFERIKDSGLTFNAVTYNEMMTLYMSVGQVEKVSSVIEDLKSQKVVPDLFTYNLWISSCAAALDIGRARSVIDEMSQDCNSDERWVRYRNLADIYITTGQLTDSGASSLVETEKSKSFTQRDWITYDFLIILHAGMANKGMVDQIWKSLRMTKQKMIGRNYVPIMSSYLMLGHMEEVAEVLDQWKNSTTSVFDRSVCDRLVDAFLETGFPEKAEAFRAILDQSLTDSNNESK